MRHHGIGAFDYNDGETSLSLRLAESVSAMQILSPAPGRFHADHPAGAKLPGSPRVVRKGDLVGWLRVGPLVLAVRADHDGALGDPVVADGSIVGYGTRLF